MELHDGTLAIQSEPGLGTTVSLTLPLRAPERAAGRASLDVTSAVTMA